MNQQFQFYVSTQKKWKQTPCQNSHNYSHNSVIHKNKKGEIMHVCQQVNR